MTRAEQASVEAKRETAEAALREQVGARLSRATLLHLVEQRGITAVVQELWTVAERSGLQAEATAAGLRCEAVRPQSAESQAFCRPEAVPQLTASDVVRGDIIAYIVGGQEWRVMGPLPGGLVKVQLVQDTSRVYQFDGQQLAQCRLVSCAPRGWLSVEA